MPSGVVGAAAGVDGMVMSWLRTISISALMIAAGGCAAAPVVPASIPDGEPPVPVYLVSHGLHTGMALRRVDIPAGLWPEAGDFPRAEYLEVGWGDHDYYRTRDPGLWTALKAVLVPTSSVLHVVGFRGPPAEHFAASEVVRLELPRRDFARLAQYIHDAHRRDGATPAAALGEGLYGDSRFYPARERFHLFNTCNLWSARALRAAGLPVEDAITAGGLMSQVRALAGAARERAP
jgi:uncharacterized protein (TIGR02117 family)